MTNIELGLSYLNKANAAYAAGNPADAQSDAIFAEQLLQGDADVLFDYFNSITLLQSIASLTGNLEQYQAWEKKVETVTKQLFGDLSGLYYAFHQYDCSEFYASLERFADAGLMIREANTVLTNTYGDRDILLLFYHYFSSRLRYKLEDYYACIDLSLTVNELYINLDSSIDYSDPFLNMLCHNTSQLERMGIQNLILLASAYGKINNCESGIDILQQLQPLEGTDYYMKAAIDLNLAELYARRHNFEKALDLMSSYRNASYNNYPDLAACMDTINFLIHFSRNDIVAAPSGYSWSDALSSSIRGDYLRLHRFNLAVSLASQGKYKESLMCCTGMGNKGLSLQLALHYELKQYKQLLPLFQAAQSYYLNEISNIFSYYNESLVYNHLEALEYHTSLCIGTLFSKEHQESGYAVLSEQLYNFCLNTKGITLEGSYILRQFSSLSALKKRTLYKTADLQERLTKNTVLLEFTLIRTLQMAYYGVFIIDQSNVAHLQLYPQDQLDDLILHYRDYITNRTGSFPPGQEDNGLTLRLRRALFLPLKKYLDGRNHIIIAPAGELYHLPFELLFTNSQGETTGSARITYVNIGRELALPVLFNSNSLADNALIIGNPQVSKLPDLPCSALEAREIARLMHTIAYQGSDASRDLLYCQDHRFSLLHIAAHGFYGRHSEVPSPPDNSEKPANDLMKECGLYLAGEDPLTADDISELSLSGVRLCVLSACDSGMGGIVGNEGSFGLRRGFFLAGCRLLLINLWSIYDLAGMQFMKLFYEGLVSKKLSAAAALEEAKQAMRGMTVREWLTTLHSLLSEEASPYLMDALHTYSHQNGASKPFAHPYYWAGYVLVGCDPLITE